ncbi:MAG: hypothetical protein ACOX1N_01135 [Candidatus Methanomethylophilaceae archaeon]|jgi:hypothetical protein
MMNKFKNKILVAGLIVILLTSVPAAFADPELGDDNSVTAYFTLQSDGQFVKGNDTENTVMALVPVTVSYFPLEDYWLGDYEYTDANGDIAEVPTVLHLLITALEEYYCPGTKIVNNDDTHAMNLTGSAGSSYFQTFWGHDENFMYFLNHKFPLKPDSESIGATSDEIPLENDMIVEVSMFTDWNFYQEGAFAHFSEDFVKSEVEEELTLSLMAAPTFPGTVSKIKGAEILIFEEVPTGSLLELPESEITTDANGNFTYSFDTPGTYYISALINDIIVDWGGELRNFSDTANTTSPLCKVTVVEEGSTSLHKVTFMDDDETTVIGTVNVVDGENASFSTIPTKAQSGNIKYTFSGWSPEDNLINVTEDRVVYATYSETVIPTPPVVDPEGPGEGGGSADPGNGNNGGNFEMKFVLPIAGVIVLVAAALIFKRRV